MFPSGPPWPFTAVNGGAVRPRRQPSTGTVGEVNASLAPNGYVQRGARSYVDDAGLWLAFVMVGWRQVDRKEQNYPPHGSVNPKDLRSGQVLRFLVYHVDTNGKKSVSRPDAACLLP